MPVSRRILRESVRKGDASMAIATPGSMRPDLTYVGATVS